MTPEQQVAEQVAQTRKYRQKAHAAWDALEDAKKALAALISQTAKPIPARLHEADAALDDLRELIADELQWDTNHRYYFDTKLITGTVTVEYDNEWVITGTGPDNTRWKADYVGSEDPTNHMFVVEQQ